MLDIKNIPVDNINQNRTMNARFVKMKNQMDVKMDLTDPEMAFVDPKRLVALHYTIMDKDGKQINGGLASSEFPGTESRLNYIIGGNFYKLSAEVLGSLFKAEKKQKESEEKDNRKSKTKAEESE